MTELRINQEYFMKVEPDYYDTNLLSGNGTLVEQVIEYEKDRIEKDGLYLVDMKRGKTVIEVVPDLTIDWCGELKIHSKHTFFGGDVKFKCLGKPVEVVDGVVKGREELAVDKELDDREVLQIVQKEPGRVI